MRLDKIKRVVKRLSKIYGVENCFNVSRAGRDKFEIRTELPSYEGGEVRYKRSGNYYRKGKGISER